MVYPVAHRMARPARRRTSTRGNASDRPIEGSVLTNREVATTPRSPAMLWGQRAVSQVAQTKPRAAVSVRPHFWTLRGICQRCASLVADGGSGS